MILVDLIYNLSVLVALSVLSGFIDIRFNRSQLKGKVFQGILFGLVAIVGMLYPFRLTDGVIFDGRSIVISLNTLFFGPLSGLISSLMSIVFRNYIGGGGALTGTLVISSSYLIGFYFYYLRQSQKIKPSKLNLYLFGLIVSAVMMALMITLPSQSIEKAFKTITMTVMITYPLITLIIGKVLLDQEENKNSLERIKQEISLFRTTLYSIGDAVITTDQYGKIQQMNYVAEQLTGWKEAECKGSPLEDVFKIINELTQLEVESPVVKVLREGKVVDLANHTLLVSRDGKVRPIADSGAPIRNEKKEILGTVLVFRDKTEEYEAQTALRESEEKFRNLFENHVAIKLLINPATGEIIDANFAAAKYYGWSREQLRQMKIQQINSLSVEQIKREMEKARKGNRIHFEFRHKRADGSERDVEVYSNQIKIGDRDYLHSIVHDITEKRKAEEQLEKHRNHLEVLVEERTEEIDTINRELIKEIERKEEVEKQLQELLEKEKELVKLKSRFISTASHEFRTPLTSVLSSAEMIQRYGKIWTEDKFNLHINRIKNSVDYLTKLMDDVLTMNRNDSGKFVFNPAPLNLRKLCQSLLEESQIKLNTSQRFEFEYTAASDEYNLDSKQMTTILQNLISNSIKYSQGGGLINLQVCSDQEFVKIKISDEGIGIPGEDLPRLFEPFHRSINAEDIQGTGLGLSIVKSAVELHNGTITVDTTLGKGTAFTVKLPIKN